MDNIELWVEHALQVMEVIRKNSTLEELPAITYLFGAMVGMAAFVSGEADTIESVIFDSNLSEEHKAELFNLWEEFGATIGITSKEGES